jgi:alpha-mannosidase
MPSITKLAFPAAVLLIAFQGAAFAGEIQSLLASHGNRAVSGYAKTLSGDPLSYHSANPAVNRGIVSRASKGKGTIRWETDPVPAHGGKQVRFAWLAALSHTRGEHRFRLTTGGGRSITFTAFTEGALRSFSVQGEGGAELTFVATEVDQWNDRFGYMFLSLPSSDVQSGRAIQLQVSAEEDDSHAWFILYEHRLADSVSVRPLPALLDMPTGPHQPIRVTIENYSGATSARVTLQGEKPSTIPLSWGLTTADIPVAPVQSPVQKRCMVSIGKRTASAGAVRLSPVEPRTFCLLPHSHTDIGYSSYQPLVEADHHAFLDSAIALSALTAGYPEGSRFKWNVEVMWPLHSYLAGATEARRKRLEEAVHDGRVCLNALEGNIMMGLCRPEELAHLADEAALLRREFGVPISSAMISDVPSYGWSIVDALSRSGVRYFSSGPNYMPNLPDLGDRIGSMIRNWGDKPAYWVSQSGRDTLLFWMAGHGYSWFHRMTLGDMMAKDPSQIFDYVDKLADARYPYELVQVRYTIRGDNGPPDGELPNSVRSWNEKYLSPKFAIMTTAELFSTFERRYGRLLPVIRGDMTPHWEDGAASSPSELSLNRRSVELLAQAESLAVQLGRPLDADSLKAAWRDILLFDEHTWGAAGSVSDPDSPETARQWAYKKEFALSGARRTAALRRQIIPPFPRSVVNSLRIVNPSSWNRTELVIIPDSISLSGNRVTDDQGRPVASQALSSGGLAVLVTDVPAKGSLGLRFSSGKTFDPPRRLELGTNSCTNGAVGIAWDGRTGGLTEFKIEGVNLVDRTKGAINEFIYLPGRDPAGAIVDSGATASVVESGPLVATVRFTSKPPGSRKIERFVTMAADLHSVDIVDRCDRERVLSKESIHFSFPFRLTGGEVRVDGGSSVVRPGIDQLPGANHDYFCASRWADVSNRRIGVTLAVPDAPFLEVGAITSEILNASGTRNWRESVPAGMNLYSYVMNNYWHTNYRSDEEGLAVFEYRLTPHGPFDEIEAGRRGAEAGQPLIIMP